MANGGGLGLGAYRGCARIMFSVWAEGFCATMQGLREWSIKRKRQWDMQWKLRFWVAFMASCGKAVNPKPCQNPEVAKSSVGVSENQRFLFERPNNAYMVLLFTCVLPNREN